MKFISPQASKILIAFVSFSFTLLITACQRNTTFPLPTSTPIPTPTFGESEVSADCLWRATGKAWNDVNKNGIWDSTEKPLANITFWVDDPLNNYQKVNDLYSDTVLTNSDGNLEIIVGLPGCPNVELEVYTEVPQNCELTTKARIPADLRQENEVFSFGFACH